MRKTPIRCRTKKTKTRCDTMESMDLIDQLTRRYSDGIPIRHRYAGEAQVIRRAESSDDGEDQEREERIVGLAVPYSVPTRIKDIFDGEFDEQMIRGVFAESIKRGGQVSMFEHGTHPLLGRIPIGSFERLEEQARGLEYDVLPHRNWMVEPILDGIRSGAISGSSVMFIPRDVEIEERDDDVPLVSILRADLIEAGPVVFPAYPTAESGLRAIAYFDTDGMGEALPTMSANSTRGGEPPKGQVRWKFQIRKARLGLTHEVRK
jgi:HK97 family phage prohead protease